jgi:energy-coupling factor transporter transmembrane protein EcfT
MKKHHMVRETVRDKSVGAALVLTFLFGPLGIFYVSILWAVVFIVLAIVVAVLTLGLRFLLVWPASMILAAAIVATRPRTEVFETESAQEAWVHATTGWYCEQLGLGDAGAYGPINETVLELLARGENEVGSLFGEGDPEPTFRCTHKGT